MLTLLFVTAASADNQDDLTIKSIDDVIIIESNEDTTTLGDLMSAMGIKQEDFVSSTLTKHTKYVEMIAKLLLKKETISQHDIDGIIPARLKNSLEPPDF